MHPPAVSVGVISSLVHLAALVMMTLTCMVGTRCLRHLANFRLNRHGRAPVVFHAYSTSFGSVQGMLRLLKLSSPGFSIVLILVFLLLPAEIVLNFAVDTSDRCQPKRLETKGLCAATRKAKLRIENGIFYSIQSMPWDDGALEKASIRQGLRRNIQGNEYFGDEPKRNLSLPVVVAGCRVSEIKLIPPNGTTVVLGYNHRYNMYAAFREIRVGNESIAGIGAVNTKRILALSLGKRWLRTGVNLTVFEYYDSVDVQKLRNDIDPRQRWTRLSVASPIVSYNVSCATTGLSLEDARQALKWYRFTQLDTGYLRKFNITVNGRRISAAVQMTPAAATRAMIAMKFLEQESCHGETWLWTKCGIVHPKLAIPIIAITLGMMLFCAVLEVHAYRLQLEVMVPVDVVEWYNFAMLTRFQRTHVKLTDAMYQCSEGSKCAVVLCGETAKDTIRRTEMN